MSLSNIDNTAFELTSAIDDMHFANGKEHRQKYLRPSEMANDCQRKIFMGFRWMSKPSKPDGRVQRIFQRGNREEDRLVADLRSIGLNVHTHDERTGKQFRVDACSGHMAGFLDGAIVDAGGSFLERGKYHVLECKSHNDKSFKAVIKDGIELSKPEHYGQMQLYMLLTGMTRALYAFVNKNTEEQRHIVVDYNESYATRLLAKSDRTWELSTPPVGISMDKEFFKCRFCDHKAVCFGEKLPERNCRTCVFIKPLDGGRWVCEKLGDRDYKQQLAGCQDHRFNPAMIRGKVEAKGNDGSFVEYRLNDGSVWADWGPAGDETT